MEVEDVSRCMNKSVRYTNARHFIDGEYLFTAYTIRKTGNKIFRQAELTDITGQSSIIIVPLEEVEVID